MRWDANNIKCRGKDGAVEYLSDWKTVLLRRKLLLVFYLKLGICQH